MAAAQGISEKAIHKLRAQYCKPDASTLLLARATRASPLSLVVFDSDFRGQRHNFSERNMTKLKAVDQKASGRCWIMAGLNLYRHKSAAKQGRPEDFELSGAYVSFYDKLEKSVWFMDQIWQTRDEPIDSQNVQFLLNSPISDGGQFSMFVDLVEKYGVVPMEVMPDSMHAGHTRELNDILACLLRSYVPRIRASDADELAALGKNLLEKVFKLLILTLGCPPSAFVLGEKKMTPREFQKSLEPANLRDYVSLVSVPQADRPMNTVFEVEGLGSVLGGQPVRYLNVPLAVMYDAVRAMIERGERAWFGSDVKKCFHEREGLLDAQAFDWNLLLGENWAMPLLLPRSERLKFRQGAVTHAMVFVEYDQQTGSLYVENSWGPHNKKGYLHMTKDWFMEHVWQVEVLADVLPEQLVSLWRKKGSAHVRKLPRWDPLGVLLGGDNECCRESYGAKVEN